MTAVAQDLTRSVLGVSAINYCLLLPRSTDFATFEAIMKPAYPSELDRVLGLAAVQLEWDRSEPDGYANHMTTDPLPNTPAHKVLMQIALGDHQVSDYAADTEARTIGAKTNCPSFDDGRVPDTRLLWGIPCIETYPYDGSAIVYFDSGADLPVLTDTLPPDGHDPHEDPRNDAQAANPEVDVPERLRGNGHRRVQWWALPRRPELTASRPVDPFRPPTGRSAPGLAQHPVPPTERQVICGRRCFPARTCGFLVPDLMSRKSCIVMARRLILVHIPIRQEEFVCSRPRFVARAGPGWRPPACLARRR